MQKRNADKINTQNIQYTTQFNTILLLSTIKDKDLLFPF